ncbi:hypothetical protein CDAR_547231 [Caerostris darwini]|uniref:Uncharacterized protein n=1 Tax=Caerostris darwini TaxID=1538125 RepID=A0AAV4WXC6_9ARAC|nr:hypothetical protein CDAR_547231 [Caerostris darwini]
MIRFSRSFTYYTSRVTTVATKLRILSAYRNRFIGLIDYVQKPKLTAQESERLIEDRAGAKDVGSLQIASWRHESF